jgi:hypothetical protein
VGNELWKKKLQSNVSGLAKEKSCLAPAWLTQRNTFDLFFVKRFKNSDSPPVNALTQPKQPG